MDKYIKDRPDLQAAIRAGHIGHLPAGQKVALRNRGLVNSERVFPSRAWKGGRRGEPYTKWELTEKGLELQAELIKSWDEHRQAKKDAFGTVEVPLWDLAMFFHALENEHRRLGTRDEARTTIMDRINSGLIALNMKE